MIVVASWLVGVSVASLFVGGRQKETWPYQAVLAQTGTAATALTLTLTGISQAQAVIAVGLGAAAYAVWAAVLPRCEGAVSARLSLLCIGGGWGAALITAGVWSSTSHSHLATWLGDPPLTRLASVSEARALVGAGGMLFLIWPANQLVRLTLTAAEAGKSETLNKLKGGRVIGPIERLLIAGLALLGETTPAALIASAKGLLRYPELKGMGEADEADDIHAATEYLLIGSIASWLVAAAVTALVALS